MGAAPRGGRRGPRSNMRGARRLEAYGLWTRATAGWVATARLNSTSRHKAQVQARATGDFLDRNEKVYTLDYFRDLARRITQAGAQIIGIKDMAGLVKVS